MRNGLVRNWMTTDVTTARPDTHLSDARRAMSARQIRALPVLKDDVLVGIVTRRGLLRADPTVLSESSWMRTPTREPAMLGDIMTKNVITTHPEVALPKSARAMVENKIAALPVLDDQKRLVGILTTTDMFRVIVAEAPYLKEDLRVKTFMTSSVETITPDTPLIEAHRLMAVMRIRSLPVMKDDELVGIVTRTDLLNADPPRIYNKGQKDLAWQVEHEKVERIMTTKVLTIKEDDTVIDAAKMMMENKIHCLPVVDDKGEMVGILTDTDLLTMIVRKFF